MLHKVCTAGSRRLLFSSSNHKLTFSLPRPSVTDRFLSSSSSSSSFSSSLCGNANSYRTFCTTTAPTTAARTSVSDEQAKAAVRTLLLYMGEDPDREGLLNTPLRVSKALRFLTSGYAQDLTATINGAMFDASSRQTPQQQPQETDDEDFGNAEHHSETVVVRDIEFHSLCEHHMLPFIGKVHIAYIPNASHGRVIGLSKLARITDVFARRLQVQERLSREICEAVVEHTEARGAAVIVEARHMCMAMRGVRKAHPYTVTECYKGIYKHDLQARNALLTLLMRGNEGLPELV